MGPKRKGSVRSVRRPMKAVMGPSSFVSKERKVWMRLRSHTVVFDRDPDFPRYAKDPSGHIMRILYLWRVTREHDHHIIREYLGNVRLAEGQLSQPELHRLFRTVSRSADRRGERRASTRRAMSHYLRQHLRP